MQATKTNARKVALALRSHVNAVLIRKAAHEVLREQCDAIQRRLLASGCYGGDGDPRHVYKLPEEASTRFYADLDREYRAAGFTDLQPGYCPALIAEHEMIQAENALIAASAVYFPGVSNSKLLCGTKELNGLDARQRWLDLLIGLVVNSPTYRSPLSKPQSAS